MLALFDPEASIDERLDRLQEYRDEAEIATKDQILKNHTRNPLSGSLDMSPMSLERIAELPADVQAKLPPSVTEPALSKHISDRKSIPTPRSDIRTRLFGGQK